MAGNNEAVGHTHRVVDELVMRKKKRGLHHLVHFPTSSLPASFVRATPASFSFGAIRGEAEAEGLGDDVASPHPSARGGASWWGRLKLMRGDEVAMG